MYIYRCVVMLSLKIDSGKLLNVSAKIFFKPCVVQFIHDRLLFSVKSHCSECGRTDDSKLSSYQG